MKTVVIALGGNAILEPHQSGTLAEQRANIRIACATAAELVAGGWRVVLVHGNGPQVGNILLQNEEACRLVPPVTLDVCGAQSQGMLGYLLQQELQRQTGRVAVSLVTQVAVDPNDAAFSDPTKPIGPFYPPERASELVRERRWTMREDAGRGWRRVVPSPRPVRVLEAEAVRRLAESGLIAVACGGGGVPVIEEPDGLRGVEAVIDKDLAAGVLAADLGADLLLILTGVEQVFIRYGEPGQQALGRVTLAEAEAYLAAGHFPPGSMQPKVEAAVRFVRKSGGQAVITSPARAADALRGAAGTHILRR